MKSSQKYMNSSVPTISTSLSFISFEIFSELKKEEDFLILTYGRTPKFSSVVALNEESFVTQNIHSKAHPKVNP